MRSEAANTASMSGRASRSRVHRGSPALVAEVGDGLERPSSAASPASVESLAVAVEPVDAGAHVLRDRRSSRSTAARARAGGDGRCVRRHVVDVDVARRRCRAADDRRRRSGSPTGRDVRAVGRRRGALTRSDAIDVAGAQVASARAFVGARSGMSRTSWRSRAASSALTPRSRRGKNGSSNSRPVGR